VGETEIFFRLSLKKVNEKEKQCSQRKQSPWLSWHFRFDRFFSDRSALAPDIRRVLIRLVLIII